jgi:ATP-dependent Clp protease protease subunit
LNEILAFHTHQDIEKIRKDSDRDFFMSGQEAKDYGIVDHVISRREAEATKKEK